MNNYGELTYASAGLTAFFASLSLYEWGFLIGMAFSMALGVITYNMNRREQVKRTRILQQILDKTDESNFESSVKVAAELMAKAPKDI